MTTTTRMTADELMAMPKDGYKYELIDGELVRMSTGGEHSLIGALFVTYLNVHVMPRQLGAVMGADVGFLVQQEPPTVLSPDASFVRTDRFPSPEVRHRFWPLAPDLAVEVVSPSDRPAEVAAKVARYQALGVPLVVVVDPRTRTVEVHALGEPVRRLGEGDVLDGGAVLPNFRVPVADLFPEL